MSQTQKSQDELFEEILKACEAGNLDIIKKLVKDIKFNQNLNPQTDIAYEIFIRACTHGHLNLVQYFINDPYTSEYMNRIYIINEALSESSYVNSVDIVSYLINEPKINHSIKFVSKCYLAGLEAAKHGHTEVIKALLNLESETNNRDILANGLILEHACNNKQYNLIKYLYTTPELNGGFNKDNCFKYVCIKKDFDVLRFFVFDLNIEKTQIISDFLNKNEYQEIENLFELRKLNQHLNVELWSNQNNNKKLKI
jgi:hypothetical protein